MEAPNVHIKSAADYIAESCSIVVKVFEGIEKYMKPGTTPLEIDAIAEDIILTHNATPAFKGYGGGNGIPSFPNTLCVSVNSAVVHGIPDNRPFTSGDIISVDCGTYKNGYYGDSAFTFPIGEIDEESKLLLRVTRESLFLAIQQVNAKNKVYDISRTVQSHVEKHGFSVVRELVGHGVGTSLHMDPAIPNFVPPLLRRQHLPNVKLPLGRAIAIEPMVNAGVKDVITESDNWTIRTADGKNSAHYEFTVLIQENDCINLTPFEPSTPLP